ncbi:unnamed protein product (macronuclear) [Paramecium tetraurelia]|uniref:Uncharacterized protein n=1 Tax=Paramecium tetraurelia TaxID=5888 RepID=A0CMA6_PARTE|nr:uncharacterized protein GSPATT00008402001 [Paramecium tetraurelia]CAK71923.1 unnamed protein product [Paramecium tetraurelia]|eukprot:XP_001439320.1 hypothetical protein (macronuclear) [Paramecium tetraurelia strain d4-2]
MSVSEINFSNKSRFINILEQNIEEQICFSETRRKTLNNNDYFQEQIDQKLIIFTCTSLCPQQNQFRNQDIKELALAECGLLFEKNSEITIHNFGQSLHTTDEKSYTIEK